jgi:hypothetical protein
MAFARRALAVSAAVACAFASTERVLAVTAPTLVTRSPAWLIGLAIYGPMLLLLVATVASVVADLLQRSKRR